MNPEYSNVCRLCAGSSSNFISIFEKTGPTNFAEKIKSYLHVEIQNSCNSQYEPRMCHTCCEKIVNWDQYVEQVQKVQGMFRTLVTTCDNSDIMLSIIKEEEKKNIVGNPPIISSQSNQLNIQSYPIFHGHDGVRKTEEKPKGVKKKKKKKTTAEDECDNLNIASDDIQNIEHELNHAKKYETDIRLKIKPINIDNDVSDKSNRNEENVMKENDDEDIEKKKEDLVKGKDFSQSLFMWECMDCHAPVKNWNALVKHCRENHDSNACVQCVCGKILQTRASIMKHRMTHVIGYGYKCEYENCNKTFHRRQLLEVHSVSHMPKEQQPWMCCKCSRRFHTEPLLKQHEKIHLPKEEKLVHPCQVCQKKFCSKSAVSAHVRAVHFGERPFVCDQCGHSFTSKGILHEHLTIHSDVCNFHCKECNKSFKTKFRLKIHMDTHVSTRYQCPMCNLTLNTRRTLRMHLLVHKEDRAFKCSTCGKAFKRSKDLKNHCNLHTGRRPYTCPFCQRTFANGSNCRSHKRRMHPEELKMYEAALATGQAIDFAKFKSSAFETEPEIGQRTESKRKSRKCSKNEGKPASWASSTALEETQTALTGEENLKKESEASETVRDSDDFKTERDLDKVKDEDEDEEYEDGGDEGEMGFLSETGSENLVANISHVSAVADPSSSLQFPSDHFQIQFPPPRIPAFPGHSLFRQ